MGVKETFGDRLKGLRGAINQKELADALGISRASVGYYENGTRTPDIEVVEKASQYFGVSSDYLLGRTDIKTPDVTTREIHEKTGLSEKNVEHLMTLRECANKHDDESLLAIAQIWFINSLLEDKYTLADIAVNASDYEYIKNHAKPGESLTEEELDDFLQEGFKKFGSSFRYTTGSKSLDLLLFNCQQHFTDFIRNLTYEMDTEKDGDTDAT